MELFWIIVAAILFVFIGIPLIIFMTGSSIIVGLRSLKVLAKWAARFGNLNLGNWRMWSKTKVKTWGDKKLF